MTKLVKVGVLGQDVKEYALEDDAKVEDALSAANHTLADGEEVRCNGDVLSGSDPIDEEDILIVAPKSKQG